MQLDGYTLISSFFSELQNRNHSRCQGLIEQVKQIPDFQDWGTYLLGVLLFEQERDFAAAERIFQSLADKSDLDIQLKGRLEMGLGRVLDVQGYWTKAIDAYTSAISSFQALDSPLDQVSALRNIAATYQKGCVQGTFHADLLQAAIQHCHSALEIIQSQSPVEDEPKLDYLELAGAIWHTLGTIHLTRSMWDEAIEAYQSDIEIGKQLQNPYGIAVTYLNLGEAYQGKADYAAALDAYQHVLGFVEAEQSPTLDLETELHANLGYLYQDMQQTETAIEHYVQAIQLIESQRQKISALETRAAFFSTTIELFYAHIILAYIETGMLAEAFHYVEQARARSYLDMIDDEKPILEAESQYAPLTLGEVQKNLPSDALLVEYFTTGLIEDPGNRIPSGATYMHRHRFPPAKTFLFAITKEAIACHELALSPNKLHPQHLAEAAKENSLNPKYQRFLYKELVLPIEQLKQDKQWIFLVPHGPLHYVPFQSLLDTNNHTLLQEDGPYIVYVPSASFLCHKKPIRQSSASRSCLAISYSGDDSTNHPLLFVDDEARIIAQQTEGVILSGRTPKKETLFRDCQSYSILHFACHGLFDPENPLQSFLTLAPHEKLTAEEVHQRLKLNCDLVVMSACESGLSQVMRGDELMGFMRAFLHVGARAVIATLWQIDDFSTRILMEQFYKELQAESGNIAIALHHAQCYLRNLSRQDILGHLIEFQMSPRVDIDQSKLHELNQRLQKSTTLEKPFASPYFWAPFILVTDLGIIPTH